MIVALLIAAQAVSFKADFPKATVTNSPFGGAAIGASGFAAKGLGASPQAAAQAFLRKYGETFGVTSRQKLVSRGVKKGVVRFERQLDGDPIFEADLEVTVGPGNAVTAVKTSPVPAETNGAFQMTKEQGMQAAFNSTAEPARNPRPRAARGWKSDGSSLRPVWRVDLIAGTPEADWRSYVSAENGALLMRLELSPPKPAPKRDLAL